MTRPKVIYRKKYVIDIRITDERHTNETWDRMIQINESTGSRDLSRHKYEGAKAEASEKFDYFEKHFPEAVKSLYFGMMFLESMALRPGSTADVRSVMRNSIVESLAEDYMADLRQRLGAKKGAIPKNLKHSYIHDREEFQKVFVDACFRLWNAGKKESRLSIALAWPKWSRRTDRNRGVKMCSHARTLGFSYDQLIDDAKKSWQEKNNTLKERDAKI